MCLKTLVNLCCIFLLYVTFFSSFFLVFVVLYVIFSSFCLNQHSYLQAEDKSNSVMCVSIRVLLLHKVINFNKAISLYFFVRQYSRLINFLYFHCIQIHTHQSHSSLCVKERSAAELSGITSDYILEGKHPVAILLCRLLAKKRMLAM